jgi:hypothetical protein
MRLAFVLRLGSDSRPAKGFLDGWVEEVDTCTEIRFRSTEELLKFLTQRSELAVGSPGKSPVGDRSPARVKKKPCRKGKKSP